MTKLEINVCIAVVQTHIDHISAVAAEMTEDEAYEELDLSRQALKALKSELYGFETGELVEIQDGVAHVVGYYEENLNDDGPHPIRYVEVNGLIMDYQELCKRVWDGVGFAELEAEYPQCPQDEGITDEDMADRYIADREEWEEVHPAGFCLGLLRDGRYFVTTGRKPE